MLVPSLAVMVGMAESPWMAEHHVTQKLAWPKRRRQRCRDNVQRFPCGVRLRRGRAGEARDSVRHYAALTIRRGISLFHTAHAARVSRAAERLSARYCDLLHPEEPDQGEPRAGRQLPAVDGRPGLPGVLLRTGARPVESLWSPRPGSVHHLRH